jgi:hypothetical protein
MEHYTKRRVCGNCGHDGFIWENVSFMTEGLPERIVARRACARCNVPSPYGDNDILVDHEEKRTTDAGAGCVERLDGGGVDEPPG